MVLQHGLSVSGPQVGPPAPFDAEFRRSVRGFLDRDIAGRKGIGPSRLGRMATGDPGFVRECIVLGADVQLDTADAVRRLIGEAPFRGQFCREVESFLELTGAKPWVIGWRSVRNASFVQRLQRGSSPYLRTVDGVRHWMYGQLSAGQRRAVFAAVPGTPPFGPAPTACPVAVLGRAHRAI
ncbi:MAG: hypothetical protein OXQ89_11790 [Rhodospirillaceae bacterium]|nr:hypothetical protein [Rhodospirillaceae bacterium]